MSAAHYSHNVDVDTKAVLAEFDRSSRRDVVSSDPTVRVERDERSTLFIGERLERRPLDRSGRIEC